MTVRNSMRGCSCESSARPNERIRSRCPARALRPTEQALDAEPLLTQHAAPVVARAPVRRWKLVADTGGVVLGREDGGAEQHVPPREQHAKVAAAQHTRLARHLMPQPNCVMQAMEAWRDQQPVAEPPEMQPHVGVLKALQQLRNGNQQNVLRRLKPDDERRDGKHRTTQYIVEDVVAVIGPQRHLLLTVMQRMQIDQKADDSDGRDTRPPVFDVQMRPAPETQLPIEVVDQRLQREKHQQREETQAMKERVEDVGAHGVAVLQRFDRAPALQRAENQQQHRDLHQPHQQPFGAGVGIFDVTAQADGIGDRHHDVLEEHILRLREGVGDPVEHVSEPLCVPGGQQTRPGSADDRAVWRSRSPCAPDRRSAAPSRLAPKDPCATRCPDAPW
ncbi:hypothetical protein COLO4_02024 [Corchorus olitorius]|uniref:Uncharacterized protein n=1 Tax=Corchorus olitorius TaxID=93759 RepID=A0A1R3L1M8_9ROSI|nr:hypothetical protein COLO4_02024 [Corchorus olitorius]